MSNKNSAVSTISFPKIYKISISPKQVIRVLFIICLLVLLTRITETILTIFMAFIIMAASKPLAGYLNQKLKLSEGASISLVFIAVFLIVGILIYLVGKPLSGEVATLISNIPSIADSLVNWLSNLPIIHSYFDEAQLRDALNNILTNLADQINTIANTIGNTVINAFRGVVSTLFTLIFSIYLYLDRENIKEYIIRVFRLDYDKFNVIYERIETQLGAWVRGQLVLAFVVGFFTYIGLLALGVEYALPLALLAAMLEIVPVIGPIITGIILTIIGISISPLTGILSLGLSILIQQTENNFLVPIIMKRAVGLSPVVTIASILIGQELFGLMGAVIAVPAAAMITVIFNTYLDDRDHKIKVRKEKSVKKEEIKD